LTIDDLASGLINAVRYPNKVINCGPSTFGESRVCQTSYSLFRRLVSATPAPRTIRSFLRFSARLARFLWPATRLEAQLCQVALMPFPYLIIACLCLLYPKPAMVVLSLMLVATWWSRQR
jgi:hypothetical protein